MEHCHCHWDMDDAGNIVAPPEMDKPPELKERSSQETENRLPHCQMCHFIGEKHLLTSERNERGSWSDDIDLPVAPSDFKSHSRRPFAAENSNRRRPSIGTSHPHQSPVQSIKNVVFRRSSPHSRKKVVTKRERDQSHERREGARDHRRGRDRSYSRERDHSCGRQRARTHDRHRREFSRNSSRELLGKIQSLKPPNPPGTGSANTIRRKEQRKKKQEALKRENAEKEVAQPRRSRRDQFCERYKRERDLKRRRDQPRGGDERGFSRNSSQESLGESQSMKRPNPPGTGSANTIRRKKQRKKKQEALKMEEAERDA